ncbi:heparinase II/III domain-containing protein [Oribacterium sp. WCC10]|uniref:heparinase II/III domain-containing protein n=1 Tax=Oribacterium sp. WCC10 TaxID=1855343 RepID=UPI0008F129CC|nr:heparinase II/III family protein [Oribacterium sp. WCC10]SFG51109.1 Heparinase II/III-like protein [Oribacterium sp. WCC10]
MSSLETNSIANNQKQMRSESNGILGQTRSFLLPDITDRRFWENLPDDYKKERLKLSEKALAEPWSEIQMSDYLRFSEDGNRVLFEEKFFKRRRMLTHLVMGECIENKGRFLSKIIDGIYLIMGETTWCLPAHNSYIRDTRQYTYPDVSRPVVDLFAGETGAILSVSEKLLRPVLNSQSPYINIAIDNALYERVLSPYLKFHFWWMGNGLEPMCNWTPWITQNVLLTAFTRPVCDDSDSKDNKITVMNNHTGDDLNIDSGTVSAFSNSIMSSKEIAECLSDKDGRVDPPDWKSKHLLPTRQELEKIYDSSVKSVHHFLSEYAEDGCCDEGAQYYSHAGLCLFGCLSILNDISDAFQRCYTGTKHHFEKEISCDRFNDSEEQTSEKTSSTKIQCFRDEFSSDAVKIHNIATYIMKVHVGDDYYINFADCSPHAGRRGAREYLFGSLVSDPSMMDFAAKDYRSETWEERLSVNEENLWYHVLNARCHEKMMKHSADHSPKADAWFPGTGLMVTRDSHYVLAAKAGDNADSHNHNDAGSFIIYKDNRPFIIDLGVGSYTKKTFSKDRYDIWTMQSQYHNLPCFYDSEGNLLMEHDGEEYRATNVSCSMDTSLSMFSMDLQNAYPGLDGVFNRIISFHKGSSDIDNASFDTLSESGAVSVEDHYDGNLTLVENIICYEKPETEDSCRDTSLSENAGFLPDKTGSCHQDNANSLHNIKEDKHIIRIGTIGKIKACGFSDITIEELPIADPRLGETWKHSCYRIRMTASQKDVTLSFI